MILGDLGVTGGVSPDIGTLALLARVLPRMWRFRHEDTITTAGYRAAGGINRRSSPRTGPPGPCSVMRTERRPGRCCSS